MSTATIAAAPPSTAPALDAGCLTGEEIERFHAEGFLVKRSVYRSQEVAGLMVAFDHLAAVAEAEMGKVGSLTGPLTVRVGSSRITFQPDRGAPEGMSIRHIAWCGGIAPELRRTARDPRLMSIAGSLLRSDRMHHIINQAHFKAPGSSVAFDWHQDSLHRGLPKGDFIDLNGTGSYVQTVIAIDPVTSQNGPLALVRGSSRAGHLQHEGSAVQAHIDPQDIRRPELAPGDVLVFGPYTIHGSTANRSRIARRSLINGFAYPGATLRAYASADDGEGGIIEA